MATDGFHLPDADGDFDSLVFEQRCELMAAQTLESDLELAFDLQLQEALAASLAAQPSTSSSSINLQEYAQNSTSTKADGVCNFPTVQAEELAKLEQSLNDHKESEIETRRMREDLLRRIHDQRFAREISRIPEDDWKDWGDNFEKPYDAGCSSSNGARYDDEIFRLYVKGLVREERVKDVKTVLAGIGVAICDSRDNLIFEVRKPLFGNGMSKNGAEAKALIEGLNAAHALELKRLTFLCDYYPLARFVDGRWGPKRRKISMLIDRVKVLTKKFESFKLEIVPRNEIKFAFELARGAIESQITKNADSSQEKALNETCVICLEDTDSNKMFPVDDCLHRYCTSCMKQHAEVKLLHRILPQCPHEGCKSNLTVDSCAKLLAPKYVETMRELVKEASIPVAEKVYCPHPRCSALMSRTEVLAYSKDNLGSPTWPGAKKCMNCQRLFCLYCKVPWHSGMLCPEYKKLNPNPPSEDVKLKSLATRNLWRQCKKCGHVIELAEGCYHMTCRCGSEFCYNCGAEWMNKKATCTCPLWDEDNILLIDDSNGDEEDEEEEEEDEEEEEEEEEEEAEAEAEDKQELAYLEHLER